MPTPLDGTTGHRPAVFSDRAEEAMIWDYAVAAVAYLVLFWLLAMKMAIRRESPLLPSQGEPCGQVGRRRQKLAA
jgi:hypothetical protein